MKYAYIRVSTEKQEFDRQHSILSQYNVDGIFEEKISGTKKATTRPAFEEMVKALQPGDEIYFESMSRMARSIQDLIETTNYLVKEIKVRVIFIKENLSVGGSNGLDAMTTLMFHIMGAFAQFERDMISDRTKQGLKAKKEMGVILGAPKQYKEDTRDRVVEMRKSGKKVQEIANELGMSIATVSRIAKGV